LSTFVLGGSGDWREGCAVSSIENAARSARQGMIGFMTEAYALNLIYAMGSERVANIRGYYQEVMRRATLAMKGRIRV